MSTPDFARLPGFRDFVPEDLAVRSHVFDTWRRVSGTYGFREYDGPPLEPLDLYVEKSGEEIVSQLYNFTDKGDRAVSMRPEMTPSLARILGERSRGMSKPIRWFSIPQLFRYERQQRGRLREHFQWNVDVVGEADEAADAEVLAVALDALRAFGLTAADIHARVSDRRLLAALLAHFGTDEAQHAAAFGIIDKIERAPREKTLERLSAECGLEAASAARLTALLDDTVGDVAAVRRAFGDDEGVAAALEPVERYLATLDALGLGPFVTFDLTIVRGLAYYTGIVFEVFDRAGELRAVCGGGRYDRLLELVGGEPLPAVGFGMGDVVLGELLAEKGLLPDTTHTTDYFIVTIGDETRAPALGLARRLRDAGHSVTYALRDSSVRKQFKAAENEGAAAVVVLGPDELAKGVAVVRDMRSGGEREVGLDSIGVGVNDGAAGPDAPADGGGSA